MKYETNEYLKHLAFFIPGYFYWKNKDGIFLGCNDRQAKIAGFLSRYDMVGKSDRDLPWNAQADAIRRIELEIIHSGIGQMVEEELTLSDGKEAIFLSNKDPLYNEQGQIIGVICTATDISKRKQQESILQTTKDNAEIALENILNNVPAHIFWKDRNCVLLGCNDLQAKDMGFSSGKEMVGKTNYDVIWPNQPEEERIAQAEAITKLDLEVMRTNETYTAEEPLVLPDGSTAIYLSKKSPLHNEKGEVVGVLGISFDITEQKRSEQELQETRHKLTGMTLISSTIAHELRTPLAAFAIATDNVKAIFPRIKEGYLWAKEKEAPIAEVSPFYLKHIEKSLHNMQKEIESAFTFIDIILMNTNPDLDMGKPEIISISEIVDGALDRYPFNSSQRDLVQWDKKNSDFLVKGDRMLLTHVLFNLIKNALYYAAGRGNIHIWLEPGTTNKLYFKDTGSGISSENLPHIFDRFFSTTDHSMHPAGVGLTFCKTVMESLKGGIACESVEGQYTLFILSFSSNM